MTNLQLTKSSTESDLKRYFTAVLELSKSDNQFPINLDEVWMLVYSEKGKAVRALKKNFFEGEDYHLAQNGKVIQSDEIQNGIEVSYFLSLSCMEYFIARKVRPVFEVYRRVFHKTAAQPKQLSAAEIMLMQAQMLVESEKRIKALENKQKLMQGHQNGMDRRMSRLEQRIAYVSNWSTVAGYGIRHKIDMSLKRAMEIGRKAVKLAEQNNYTIQKVRDLRFGTVNSYPDWVLRNIFSEYYPNIKFKD